MNKIYAVDLGKTEYLKVLKIQEKLEKKVAIKGEIGYLLISETDPVITIGRSSKEEEVLYTDERLKSLGIEKCITERGGKVTLHGPGQVVGYPILNLENYKKDLRWYLKNIEDSISETLNNLEINNFKLEGKTGVWTEDGKICAIGVKVKKWVTTHGFALNHTINLDLFNSINPCGLKEDGISKIENYKQEVQRKDLIDMIYISFEKKFQCKLVKTHLNDLL